jgi:DNA primase catalytic subunit
MHVMVFMEREMIYDSMTLEEIKSFFKTLYMWITAYVSPLTISYSDFFFVLFGPFT